MSNIEIKESVHQLFLTARIGDGYISVNNLHTKANITYSSIDENYMQYKHNLISKIYKCGNVTLKNNSAGFNKNGKIFVFYTYYNEDIYTYYIMSKVEIIKNLDYFGFLLYYLDDGSYHINANVMHLYCNSFNQDEVECLQYKIHDLFGGKLCSVLTDKKKDGRKYPYLYIRKTVVLNMIDAYQDYVRLNIPSMLYKFGSPSQTIES